MARDERGRGCARAVTLTNRFGDFRVMVAVAGEVRIAMTEQRQVGRRRGIQLLTFLEEEMVRLSGAILPGFGNKTPLVADQLTRTEYLRALGGECGARQI